MPCLSQNVVSEMHRVTSDTAHDGNHFRHDVMPFVAEVSYPLNQDIATILSQSRQRLYAPEVPQMSEYHLLLGRLFFLLVHSLKMVSRHSLRQKLHSHPPVVGTEAASELQAEHWSEPFPADTRSAAGLAVPKQS